MKKTLNIFFVLQIVISICALLSLIDQILLKPFGVPYPGYKAPLSIYDFSVELILTSYIPITIISLIVSLYALRNKDIPKRKPAILLGMCLTPVLLLIAINIINM